MSQPGRMLSVSLATALDRYAELDSLTIGGVNRPRIVSELAGGKGFNAARSAIGLGVQTRVLALVGGAIGRYVQELAATEGIRSTWIETEANTRQCLSLVDQQSGRMTEFYEPLKQVDQPEWALVFAAFERELGQLNPGDLIALSRLPPGFPPDALAHMVRAGRSAGLQVIVDAYGSELESALVEHPTLVKVNEAEARAIAGDPRSSVTSVAQQLLSLGAESVIVTRGAAGAMYIAPDLQVSVRHPAVEGGLAVGSGDAFLGALAVVLTDTSIPLDAAAALPRARTSRMMGLAAAAGMANARQLPAGQINWESVTSELPSVHVRATTGSARRS